jgi:hypothetical protein
VRVATYVTSVAGALTATACSDTDGYVLVWCSDEPTPGQVRAARISHTGQLGPAITVYDAKTDIWPIAAALTAQSLKVLVYDRSRWPYRVLLKEVDRGVLTSRSADPSSSRRT